MKYIIAYGSLRHSGNWFRSLSIKGALEDIKFINSYMITGFSLYNLLDPETNEIIEDTIAAKLSEDDNSGITVDIIEISENLYNEVMKVINCSNFKGYTISVSNFIGEIFLYESEVKEDLKINSGNFFVKNLKRNKTLV